MEHEVKVREREGTLVVSRRLSVRLSEIGAVLGRSFGEVYGHLGASGGESAGPPFIIYHGTPVGDEPFELEVCAPVARHTSAPEGWQVQELPAGTFVTLLHVGPYETVGAAYGTLTEWIGAHELAIAGPPREVYLSGPETPPAEIRTVIEFPVVGQRTPVRSA
jgi:effector-binding domain-containing protein